MKLISQTHRIKINYRMFLKKWSKGWRGQVVIIFPQTDEVFSLTGSLILYFLSFMFLIVPPLILMLFLLLVNYQEYSSHGEKKIGLLYQGL